jgi:hypothetical protein
MKNKSKGRRKMEKRKSLRQRRRLGQRGNIAGGGWAVILLPFFLFSYAGGTWFGQESCPSHWAVSTGYAEAQRFQALEDGTSSRLEILTYGETGGGMLRMAVYDDSINHPHHRLWEGTDVSYVPGNWCGENVTIVQLTQNTYYWFAFKTSTTEEICYATGASDSHEWKIGQSFANPFPNPWGSYYGHNSNRYSMRMHYTTSKGTKGIIEIDPGIIEGGIIR